MSQLLSGQVALVTGAGNGIGRATAQAFAQQGVKVVVSDVDAKGGEATVELIRAAGGEATFIRCDVTRDAEVKALVEGTVAAYGRLDYASTMPASRSRRASWPTARRASSTPSWASTSRVSGCA